MSTWQISSARRGRKVWTKPAQGIELGIAGEPLFDSRHADRDQTNFTAVEEIPQLLEAGNAQSIGSIDEDQTFDCGFAQRRRGSA
jgi:hypothetical protein